MLVSGLQMKNFQVLRNKICRIGASGLNYQHLLFIGLIYHFFQFFNFSIFSFR